jgi:hypothetical protein
MKINTCLAVGLNLVAAMSLAACAQNPPLAVEVREVQVPTPVACIKPEQIPPEPERVGPLLTGNAVADLATVAASALELRIYGGELRALIEGCVE